MGERGPTPHGRGLPLRPLCGMALDGKRQVEGTRPSTIVMRLMHGHEGTLAKRVAICAWDESARTSAVCGHDGPPIHARWRA